MPIRSLGLLALVLALIFGLQLLGVLFPWQPLAPAWQLRLGTALTNGATLPLLSLALLQIAVWLDPQDPLLRQRQRLFRQLAVLAAVGYLLLLPLQLTAGLRQQNDVSNAQLSRIRGAERRLQALRQLTAEADSPGELNAELQKLQGPVLGPADLTHPLPLLKAQVNAVFDQAQIQINRDRISLPPTGAMQVLPQLMGQALSCLLLACAFAGFARRASSEHSLLDEVQRPLMDMQFYLRRLNPFRRGRGRTLGDAEYIRQMQPEEPKD
jgi:hypothetical protein